MTATTVTPMTRQHAPADNIQKDGRNVFATMAVFAGIASWVPLVIVMALPLTYISALLAVVTAVRKDARHGLKAAWIGVVLGTTALVVHVSIAALGGVVGLIGDLLSRLF